MDIKEIQRAFVGFLIKKGFPVIKFNKRSETYKVRQRFVIVTCRNGGRNLKTGASVVVRSHNGRPLAIVTMESQIRVEDMSRV